jgi:hypothetical protein
LGVNFVELRLREVRRIPLLRGWVNKATTPQRSLMRGGFFFLKGLLDAGGVAVALKVLF